MKQLYRVIQLFDERFYRYSDSVPAWYQDRMKWYATRRYHFEDSYGVVPPWAWWSLPPSRDRRI